MLTLDATCRQDLCQKRWIEPTRKNGAALRFRKARVGGADHIRVASKCKPRSTCRLVRAAPHAGESALAMLALGVLIDRRRLNLDHL